MVGRRDQKHPADQLYLERSAEHQWRKMRERVRETIEVEALERDNEVIVVLQSEHPAKISIAAKRKVSN